MENRMSKTLTRKKHELMLLARTLDGYSPAKKISSGYAYVETKGTSIKTIRQVRVSDEITVHVADGNLKALVTEVNRNE